jgi:hypothetical protein
MVDRAARPSRIARGGLLRRILIICAATALNSVAWGIWPVWSAGASGPTATPGFAPLQAPTAAPIQGSAPAAASRSYPGSLAPSAGPIPEGTWGPLGPAAIGPPYKAGGGFYGGVNSGRITGLAVIPSGTNAGRIVAATAGGGIWTSDDNGEKWTPRTDSAADLAIGSITDDPSNAEHLIAGTGEANQCGDCFPGTGILVSTDGGSTWSLQNPGGVFSGVSIAQVAINPTNSKDQFAATNNGLFVTTDGGTKWAKPTDPSYAAFDGNITAVVINPKTPETVYIGGGPKVVGESTDGGVKWAEANTGITPPKGGAPFTALAIAASSPSTLYASVGTTTEAVALYQTTNGGGSWSKVTAAPDYTGGEFSYGEPPNSEQGWYDNVLAIDPTNAEHVLAGGIAIVETKDGGKTWANVNGKPFKTGGGENKVHPDFHALAFRGDGKVWIGDDGGAYLYTPSSGEVVNANGNLNITQFYFGFNVVGTTILAGAQDNSSATTSSSTLAAWTGLWSGDGGPSFIVPNETETAFIQSDRALAVTNNGFGSIKVIAEGKAGQPEFGLFSPPITVIPNAKTPTEPTAFYGGKDLWRTTNPSAATPTWTKVTTVGQNVSAITVSPTNPEVVYVGFVNGVIQVSTDGGATFTSTTAQPSPETFVAGLSVNPTNEKEIAASFSFNDTRYRPGGSPHVALFSYTTTPGTGTWTEITGNLPSFAVSRVVYDAGALVAATDDGVYATGKPEGATTSWARVGKELPNVQVQDLFVTPKPEVLYAITHGRGAWKLSATTASKATTTKTTLSGEGKTGESITVKEGSAVTDQATISGENAAKATGKVTYKVYSDKECTKEVTPAGEVTVSAGNVPPSEAKTLSHGTYYWQASYSGDEANEKSASKCGDEVLVVKRVGTCGKTTIGKSSDQLIANEKRVNKCAIPVNAEVSELVEYLAPTSTAGSQVIKGIVYEDSKGKPAKLLGTSNGFTFTNKTAAGWYHLAFPAPVKLAAGNYWIGVITGKTTKVAGERFDSVKNAEDYNANTYTSGPSNPFGSFKTTNEEMSLYANWTEQ